MSKFASGLKGAGLEPGELKTLFRAQKSHKRRSSAIGCSALLSAMPTSPQADEPSSRQRTTTGSLAHLNIMPNNSVIVPPKDPCVDSPVLPPGPSAGSLYSPVLPPGPSAGSLLPQPFTLAFGPNDPTPAEAVMMALDPTACAARENASPNVVDLRECDALVDEGLGTHSGSSKKVRRRRRQSFNLNEIDQRIREIAESGASPLPPKHGLPSAMVPLGPSLAAQLAAVSKGPNASSPMPMPIDLTGSPAPEWHRAVPPLASPCVDLGLAQLHAPLSTCAAVSAHIESAARQVRFGPASALEALRLAVREVCTFAELSHWEEESRLAVRAVDREPARAPRVRFCAMQAACLEPPSWSDGESSSEAQLAALDALLPLMRASDELSRALGALAAPKVRRFLERAAELVRSEPRLQPSGAARFWHEQLLGLARGEGLYAARAGSLVRSLVRQRLRSLAAGHETAEAEALRELPSPRSGPVLHADADSVARLLSNGLRVWEAHAAVLELPEVQQALARAGAQAQGLEAQGSEALLGELLPREQLLDLLAAADAHAVLSHLVLGCGFVRSACAPERGGGLAQLLELAPLVPGWVDEFTQLARLPELDAQLERARAPCKLVRALVRARAAPPSS